MVLIKPKIRPDFEAIAHSVITAEQMINAIFRQGGNIEKGIYEQGNEKSYR